MKVTQHNFYGKNPVRSLFWWDTFFSQNLEDRSCILNRRLNTCWRLSYFTVHSMVFKWQNVETGFSCALLLAKHSRFTVFTTEYRLFKRNSLKWIILFLKKLLCYKPGQHDCGGEKKPWALGHGQGRGVAVVKVPVPIRPAVVLPWHVTWQHI